MRRGLHTSGFTIVEILIFLAVSSLLLVGAFSLITGQQARTEFSQSIRDIQTQIDDVINTVASGYYVKSSDFKCTSTAGGPPNIVSGVQEQGTNKGCIFIGRAMQFGIQSQPSRFNTYNLVGLQYKDPCCNNLVTDLDDAKTRVQDPTDHRTLLYGLNTTNMTYRSIGSVVDNDVGVVAFVSSLGTPNVASSGLISGSQTVDLYAVENSNLNKPAANGIALINAGKLTAASQVTICFEGGINQSGLITIGSNNRQLSTKLEIKNSTDCT